LPALRKIFAAQALGADLFKGASLCRIESCAASGEVGFEPAPQQNRQAPPDILQ
jgi:hypothetical protein